MRKVQNKMSEKVSNADAYFLRRDFSIKMLVEYNLKKTK